MLDAAVVKRSLAWLAGIAGMIGVVTPLAAADTQTEW